MADSTLNEPAAPSAAPPSAWARARSSLRLRVGGALLLILLAVALLAPWLGTLDASLTDATLRDLRPGAIGDIAQPEGGPLKHRFLLGSDSAGRDIYGRVLYATRTAAELALATALLALACSAVLGLLAAFVGWLDAPLMRLTDSLQAIPTLLTALALMTVWKGGLTTLVLAIALPESARVARRLRDRAAWLREQPYAQIALTLGTPAWLVLLRHGLAPLTSPLTALLAVQGVRVCACAVFTEAALGFLGVGLPREATSWGSVMAEGRAQFSGAPLGLFAAGFLLSLALLALQLLADGLREALAPAAAMARK